MFVRTERLFLRPGWPEDVDELVEAISDESVQRSLGVNALPSTTQAMRDYLSRDRDPHLPHFFMYLRAPGGPRLVGGIGLGRLGRDVEMGYWIAPAFRGMGYAREAVRALLEQARALGHRRIVASHFEESPATRFVLEAAGFQDSGEYRERFSQTRGGSIKAKIFVADLTHGGGPRPESLATGEPCLG